MNSSISSSDMPHDTASEKSRSGKPSGLSARFVMTGLAAMIAVALLRTDIQLASAPDWYWRMKVEWKNEANIVLAGDSRVYRGLDPHVFDQYLPHLKTVNFGFSSVRWSLAYLDKVSDVLKSHGKERWIVLGVSPPSLRPAANTKDTGFENDGFGNALKNSNESRLSAGFERRLASILLGLRRLPLDYWWARMTGKASEFALIPENQYLQRFELSGWVASDYVKRDSGQYVKKFSRNGGDTRFDQETYARLLGAVRSWRRAGIGVIAFRPPVPASTLEFEINVLEYQEQRIAADMRSAGATWVDIDITDYISYDGSHVESDSARKLSLRLATEMVPRYRVVTEDEK